MIELTLQQRQELSAPEPVPSTLRRGNLRPRSPGRPTTVLKSLLAAR